MPFSFWEENGLTIPVLGVNCVYQYHVTSDDTIIIKLSIKEYNGVRMTVSYDVTDKKDGKTILKGETKHCFTNRELKPINLKKCRPDFSKKFENVM